MCYVSNCTLNRYVHRARWGERNVANKKDALHGSSELSGKWDVKGPSLVQEKNAKICIGLELTHTL